MNLKKTASNELEKTNEQFIELLKTEVRLGHGFIPLTGSGISADSGILTGEQFTNYLAFTVYACTEGQWNLHKLGWPKQIAIDIDDVKKWVAERFLDIAGKRGFRNAGSLIEPELRPKRQRRKASNFTLSTNSEAETLLSLLQPLDWPLVPELIANKAGLNHNQNVLLSARSLGKLNSIRDGVFSPLPYQTATDFIEEKAIRCLYDWRATLIFLSTLNVDGEGTAIRPSSSKIIDWFNTFITANRRPNFAHYMLANLARPLRINKVLSTNFDLLIETAFQESNHPIQCFAVNRNSTLPDSRSVNAQDSLVKLHGEITDTRADFSLDDVPDPQDINTFKAYINYPDSKGKSSLPSHILIIGFSGRDQRIIAFLRHALEANAGLRIYWMCYSPSDVERVRASFPRETHSESVIVTETKHSDLMLYELYQRCSLSLPSGGFSFTFTHKLLPRRQKKAMNRFVNRFSQLHSEWVEDVIKRSKTSNRTRRKDRVQLLRRNGFYILEGDSIMRHVDALTSFFEAKYLQCIWIELSDLPNPLAALHMILATIALRRGYFQARHIELVPDNLGEAIASGALIQKIKDLLSILGTKSANWLIYLYGRTTPGASTGWIGNYWTKDQYEELHDLLKCLCSDPLHFNVIYMPFTERRCEAQRALANEVIRKITRKKQSNHKGIQAKSPYASKSLEVRYDKSWTFLGKGLSTPALKAFVNYHKQINKLAPLVKPTDSDRTLHIDEIENSSRSIRQKSIDNVIKWVGGKRNQANRSTDDSSNERLHFLYGLLLFRQSRHPNAVMTDALYPCPYRFNIEGKDNDWERAIKTDKWMEELKATGIFLELPGGYTWIYRENRLGLLTLLDSRLNISIGKKSDGRSFDFLGQLRGRLHGWIGDWYFKAFCATGHITPLLECMHHRFTAMTYLQFYRRSHQKWGDDAEILRDRELSYLTSLNMLLKTFVLARPWMDYWISRNERKDRLQLPQNGFPQFEVGMLNHSLSPIDKKHLSQPIQKRIKKLLGQTEDVLSRFADCKADFSHYKNVNTCELPTPQLDSFTIEKDDFAKEITELLERHNYFNWSVSPKLSDEDQRKIFSRELDRGRRKWLQRNIHRSNSLLIVLHLLGENAYIHVKRAKLLHHATEGKHPDIKSNWLKACMICNDALRLSPHIHAEHISIEMLIQVKLLTLYGLALGRLGRFFESNRRLNEAQALLSKYSTPIDPIELAKINLRRAEVNILEANIARRALLNELLPEESDLIKCILSAASNINESEQISLGRIQAAKIDQAWGLLENCRGLLGGRSHSSQWWGRWLALTFRAFAESKDCEYRTLPYSRMPDPLAHLEELFQTSGLIGQSDPYRQTRFIDYYFAASQAAACRVGDRNDWLKKQLEIVNLRAGIISNLFNKVQKTSWTHEYFSRIASNVKISL